MLVRFNEIIYMIVLACYLAHRKRLTLIITNTAVVNFTI